MKRERAEHIPMLLLREPRFIGDWMKFVGDRRMFLMLLLREPRFIGAMLYYIML